ncbi:MULTISPECIES: sugar transferase [Psychrilyobacter]|uniref:Polyprenyl glycosylphosphotransferase n=1 Tax=Psychrilyobacter piezotolerans TaxID=2293438 RepID=A0ABX9KKX7_9FUSO|nr:MULTISPECIES: sugar transferase [Psychrilyobacter]MCS5420422.1 sugar transferase [Psychrilyobacter sp. S5]NDI76432.1 polyprenyl glycosylphosphotransferase [Psychrilyobacter piezotolerans]RDE66028.1 polyprenyl glycosylphosphotransferase [Psychrilyobacter sp. S5]REI43206.1 polyprenyl glycosylphosphotransferase [Psychrilyobacter piezotolerans]
MRHSKNILSRIIFFIIMYTAYYKLFHIFNRTDNAAFYLMFLIMGLAYYLVGYLDFSNGKLEKNDIVYSVLINTVLGSINYFFTKSKKEFTVFLILIIIANLIKYILAALNNSKMNVLLAGENDLIDKIKQSIINSDRHVYTGQCCCEGVDRLKEIVSEKKIDMIIITEKAILKNHQNLLLDLKLKGKKIQTYWQFNEEVEGKIDVTKIDERWLLYSLGFNILHNTLQRRVKRLFDIVMAIIISIPALPIMLLTAVLLKIAGLLDKKEAGPLLFTQIRVGLGNEPFKMFKFRSMITKENWAEVGFDPHKESWTTEGDPRVTKIGHFMRKTRLDELPQLLNVIRGEMSFVGPRPESVPYVEELERELPFYNLRHAVQPGVTGWAQVMYPYGATTEDSLRKLEFDLYYIKHQNFVMDVGIFFKTVKTVLSVKGR